MKLKREVYNIHDQTVTYGLLDRILGPAISSSDLLALEFRAFNEGWTQWYYMVAGIRNGRRRRWLLAYLRDEIITVEVQRVPDVYEDDDPWEGMRDE
jgi:hypothetical protein